MVVNEVTSEMWIALGRVPQTRDRRRRWYTDAAINSDFSGLELGLGLGLGLRLGLGFAHTVCFGWSTPARDATLTTHQFTANGHQYCNRHSNSSSSNMLIPISVTVPAAPTAPPPSPPPMGKEKIFAYTSFLSDFPLVAFY
ncbi:hypothetical protein M0804_009329 [Polistes exclamans]|nr:hypothetical protein M0804_009329 [Polistes exclamans]